MVAAGLFRVANSFSRRRRRGEPETSKETEKPPKPSAKIHTIGWTMMTARPRMIL